MHESEFELIEHYFKPSAVARPDVATGIGDDGAVLRMPAQTDLQGVARRWLLGHDYDTDQDPRDVGHRLLAGAAAQLACLGVRPRWMLLSLGLTEEQAGAAWLSAFATGLASLARDLDIALAGGDTTRGPGLLWLQALGHARAQAPSDAKPQAGDLLYVAGPLGDAGLALLAACGELRLPGPVQRRVAPHLRQPQPALDASLAAASCATHVFPLQQGLLTDLGAYLRGHGLGATLYAEHLPLSTDMSAYLQPAGGCIVPLTSPDLSSLCIVVAADAQAELEQVMQAQAWPLQWVGAVESQRGLRCRQNGDGWVWSED